MWKCSECGNVFYEPYYDHWTECHGNGIYEPWCCARCPECGSDDIEEGEFEEGEIDV